MEYQKIANEIRFFCADMVQEANSGHPGAPMGLADIAVILSQHISINPSEPQWINRDRLVFSGGHASALLYVLLYVWGYDISLQDLYDFRKINSKTPGHPEYKHTQGVEITTGPLGQGVANAVGFAMAAKRAQNILGQEIIDHKIYCFCGDGDLQEGVSYESCSLAGHHRLDNLILIYDSNNISIEGDIGIAFSENVRTRFEAQGFFVLEINGHNYNEIDFALQQAKKSEAPTLIIAKTKIAKNAYKLEGSHHAHGAPLGRDIIQESKKKLGLSPKTFYLSYDTKAYFTHVKLRGEQNYQEWQKKLQNSKRKNILESLLQKDHSNIVFPDFSKRYDETQQKINNYVTLHITNSMATRSSNAAILNAIAKANIGFMGGSADLGPSNNTTIIDSDDFPNGKNLHFGIREHAMGAISNAFANYGIFTPYCATFFAFSDYLSPSIRIASLMNAQIFYIFTHDSIGVGEDGATHQPIEQLSHFRAMPNLLNWRPADANENVCAWKNALKIKKPQTFILTRQNLPIIESPYITTDNVGKGAYIISPSQYAHIALTLLASGSEVSLAIKAQQKLESNNVATQVVSMPCYDLLIEQDEKYVKDLFKDSKVLGIEALRSFELYRYANDIICMQGFGASGKGNLLFEKFGFSVDNICNKAQSLL